ncbi:MAG: glycine dehydrogenase, partial [Muribaculaceae bacterium]|nr:glycine dehydrogenase [Muribaculaceae bacterium]
NRQGAAAVRALVGRLEATGKFSKAFPTRSFLNEVALKTSVNIDELLQRLADNDILGGVKIADDMLLVAATEMQSADDIDRYAAIAAQL